jgi:hypothetical protein
MDAGGWSLGDPLARNLRDSRHFFILDGGIGLGWIYMITLLYVKIDKAYIWAYLANGRPFQPHCRTG